MDNILGLRWTLDLDLHLVDPDAPRIVLDPDACHRVAMLTDVDIGKLIGAIMSELGSHETVRRCLRRCTNQAIDRQCAKYPHWSGSRERLWEILREEHCEKLTYAREVVWRELCRHFQCSPERAPARLHHLVWARFADLITELVVEEGGSSPFRPDFKPRRAA